jgi:hypothetical protein
MGEIVMEGDTPLGRAEGEADGVGASGIHVTFSKKLPVSAAGILKSVLTCELATIELTGAVARDDCMKRQTCSDYRVTAGTVTPHLPAYTVADVVSVYCNAECCVA